MSWVYLPTVEPSRTSSGQYTAVRRRTKEMCRSARSHRDVTSPCLLVEHVSLQALTSATSLSHDRAETPIAATSHPQTLRRSAPTMLCVHGEVPDGSSQKRVAEEAVVPLGADLPF